MAAARAVTTSMTSGSAAAKPAASATPAPSEPEKKSDASPLEGGKDDSDSKAPALFDAPKDDKKESEAEKDDDSKPKTADEVTKSFIRLGKREQKFKTKQKEWNQAVAKKEAEHAAKEEEFGKARKELINENNRLTALQRQISEKHAWVAHGQQAWDNDDKVGFAKAIEKMAKGASLAQITRWLADAGDKPKAPAAPQPSSEEQAWRREKAEWERQRAEEAAKGDTSKKQKDEAKQRDEAKVRLAEAFVKHPFLANPDDPKKPDPDALEEAFEKIRGAMKHRKPGETAKQVATRVLDELHAREVRRLKRMGLEPKTETKKKDEKKDESQQKPGQRLPEPPASNRESKTPSLDATRAHRIAAAKRMTEQQRRGVA